ncbi:SPOSA6832_03032 [Sporobolomyces salmonicolor]|uniref:Iron-sulfur assembly protein 1 n=1 Tax=Sporidiobolus salmonicolor TaxID=5005 RepID=A0A0D6EMW8_SPOSA|nr:SPOSA6832_03032 [Sporobolomyces salmonicolor]
MSLARPATQALRSSLRTAMARPRPLATVPPCPLCSALRHSSRAFSSSRSTPAPILDQTPPAVHPAPIPTAARGAAKPTGKARVARPRKAALSLSPTAVDRIRSLLDSPEPKLIRVGVRNKGCAGMSYHLDYVDKADKFDEVVEQDGVKVIIDSKALFSIIGSEMDWQEDALQARFVFKNPNIKDACGCGESFIV